MNGMKCTTLVGATLIIAGGMMSLPTTAVGEAGFHLNDDVTIETPPLEDDTYYAPDCWCGPTWTLGADAVIMHRSRPDSLLLMQDVANPARNLNGDDFNFGLQAGWDLSLARENAGRGIDFRFLSVDAWDAATTAIVGPPSLVLVNNALPTVLPGITAVNATYDSELLSAEFNLRRDVTNCCTLLTGFRYFELDEYFHADMDAARITTSYDTMTQNRLYGVQVGAETTLWSRDRLALDVIGKAGIYHNSANQNTVLNTGVAIISATDASDRTAFMGELALTGAYHLTDCISLRANYSLMWLETVALATDQVPATNFGTGGGINVGGGAFYHGALIGVEYRR